MRGCGHRFGPRPLVQHSLITNSAAAPAAAAPPPIHPLSLLHFHQIFRASAPGLKFHAGCCPNLQRAAKRLLEISPGSCLTYWLPPARQFLDKIFTDLARLRASRLENAKALNFGTNNGMMYETGPAPQIQIYAKLNLAPKPR